MFTIKNYGGVTIGRVNEAELRKLMADGTIKITDTIIDETTGLRVR